MAQTHARSFDGPTATLSCAPARRVLDAHHPDLALSLANLATVKTARGEHDEAELLLLEAHPILRRARGDLHPETRSVADLLARHYRSIGRPADALKYSIGTLPPVAPSSPPADR